MVDFAEIAGLISDVVRDEGLGASVTVTRSTPGVYDPATGTATPTVTTQTATAIIEDYSGAERMTNSLILAGDKKVSIPAPNVSGPPDPTTDAITVGGVPYAVIAVSTTEAGGVAILYVCQCRKA